MFDGADALHGLHAVDGNGFVGCFDNKAQADCSTNLSVSNSERAAVPVGPPVLLIASTTWWAFPARIAMEAASRGLAVDVICGRGHPLLKTAASRDHFRYDPLRPVQSLERAITRSGARLVLPCDDRTLTHLHMLYRNSQCPSLRNTIETSLGSSEAFDVLTDRAALIGIARSQGVEAPETLHIETPMQLERAIDKLGLPSVLKVDGSWGGFGVAVARTRQQASDHFKRLSRPVSASQAIKRLLVDRDAFHVLPWLLRNRPRVSLQAYAPGKPANCVSVCMDGEIISTVCAEAVSIQRPLGASSVVRIIENAQMARAAEILARHLKLSGVFGLDFLLDKASGIARLVEMNARATPLCHLGFGEGRDLISGIAAIAGLNSAAPAPPVTEKEVVAYFPQAWHTAPDDPWLRNGFHDVPWQDPALLRELLQKPWPDRGMLAGLRRWLMQRPAAESGMVSTERTMDVI